MTDAHEMYDELAVGWALHALEPEDESAFAAHLGGCARCADTVAGTTEAMAAMATDLPQAEPSEELRQRLRRAVEQTEQLPAPAPVPRVPSPVRTVAPIAPRAGEVRSRRRLLPALVGAAAAAIVGLGAWNVALNGDRQELRSTVAAQSAVMEALLDPHRATLAPLRDDGQPVATVVPRGDELEVVAHGLATNDADSTSYVVWGLRSGVPIPLGVFDVEGSQMQLQTVGSGLTGLDQFDEYAVSLEPGHEAPSEPTDVVATGQVTS
ncbi:MAG TPA: anti-sigma factor [Nocardioides sp.]|jgi:anti-sigma-K factor RskA|nr:anti-sigma factor [Nocardioides sp.]